MPTAGWDIRWGQYSASSLPGYSNAGCMQKCTAAAARSISHTATLYGIPTSLAANITHSWPNAKKNYFSTIFQLFFTFESAQCMAVGLVTTTSTTTNHHQC
jgi:hypothetical protein